MLQRSKFLVVAAATREMRVLSAGGIYGGAAWSLSIWRIWSTP
jgi:hypothetical protein